TTMPPPTPPFKSFETVNFYAGSSLNRLSWLRTDSGFLNRALASPRTRFLVLQNLNPLAHKGPQAGEKDGLLATLSWDEVKEPVMEVARQSGHDGGAKLFGPEANGVRLPEEKKEENAGLFEKSTAGLGPSGMVLVFLGIDETGTDTPSLPGQLAQESSNAAQSQDEGVPPGTPYFALSLTYRPKPIAGSQSEVEQHPFSRLESSLLSSGSYEFVDTRTLGRAGDWPMSDAALVAQARALVDWNTRQVYCPCCSRQQYMLWSGYKRACASTLTRQLKVEPAPFTESLRLSAPSGQDDQLGDCPSTTSLSNFSYPRTDPVVIMGILSSDGEHLLLGRQKKWPQGFYSCLAGFIEPGESLEEAVRREVLEESGVKVDRVVYHSSQSWPFPNQLMEGCFGIASPSAPLDPSTNLPKVNLDLDNELESSQWFTRKEILAVLDGSARSSLSRQEIEKIDKATQKADEKARASRWSMSLTRLIPPATAIAHVLIAAWARKEAVLP
ncbi:hypothetical protein BDZ90DRAFT_210672, partial [Jaminaea rosea]